MEHDMHNMKEMDMSSHHMNHMGNLKKKFFVSLVLAIPILLLSPMMGIELPFQIKFEGSAWMVAVLATVLFFYGGMPFLKGAKMEIKMHNPAMMTLISLGISVAYAYSMYAFIENEILHSSYHVMDFFWELASLILIMLLGHWIEMNAVQNAGNALEKLAALLPKNANVIQKDKSIKLTMLEQVQIGDHVLVKSGEKIPCDGVIVEGESSVNESMITGESKAINKHIKDKVIGGSLNGDGTLIVEVSGTGESGYLSQVMKLVSDAQNDKSKIESLSDKVAKWLFYIALSAGILAFVVWLIISDDMNTALERMVTVLVIACPHALGLAIPLVIARSTSLGARYGVLVKNRQALETANNIQVLMMDKTGTLTQGKFSINYYKSFHKKYTNNDILRLSASLERNSSHPLAQSILKVAKEKELKLEEINNVKTISGVGIEGSLKKQTIAIVNANYLDMHNIEYDKQQFDALSKEGNSISYVLIDGVNSGIIAQGDKIKEHAQHMITQLKKMHIQPIMLTGDNEQAARVAANALSIKDVYAQLKPEDKERIVKEYQAKGKQVMMVGDGINDAPSLARANVGVAIGAGTDVAIDSADIILINSDPYDILHFLTLAKNTHRKLIQNLWWGAGYNIIAIPLAAGVLAGVGIILTPSIGAILMSLSTVIVAINAMLLKIDDK